MSEGGRKGSEGGEGREEERREGRERKREREREQERRGSGCGREGGKWQSISRLCRHRHRHELISHSSKGILVEVYQ